MKKPFFRYEINQKIKRVLVSNGADVTALSFSFSGKTAWFSGRFSRITGAAMSQGEIETACRDLINMPEVQYLIFEVEDWNILCAGPGSFVITRKVSAATAPIREQKPLVIRSNADGKVVDGDG